MDRNGHPPSLFLRVATVDACFLSPLRGRRRTAFLPFLVSNLDTSALSSPHGGRAFSFLLATTLAVSPPSPSFSVRDLSHTLPSPLECRQVQTPPSLFSCLRPEPWLRALFPGRDPRPSFRCFLSSRGTSERKVRFLSLLGVRIWENACSPTISRDQIFLFPFLPSRKDRKRRIAFFFFRAVPPRMRETSPFPPLFPVFFLTRLKRRGHLRSFPLLPLHDILRL